MLREARVRRQKKIRAKINGTALRPRLSVYRSNRYTFAQAIDDNKNETIASVSELELKETKGTKTDKAKRLGIAMAEKLKKRKIEELIFDRGSFKYHGRVKALAEGLREGGIKF